MTEHLAVIVDLADFDLASWIKSRHEGCMQIPPAKRPTVLHTDRSSVEREALRLQAANPGGRFVVFTATHETALVDVPTHVNLAGTPMRIERAARLEPVTGDH